jgi:hypothetical protein
MSLGDVGGWVLDVAALAEIADGTVFAAALVDTAAHRGLTLLVPVTALAEVYAVRSSTAARERLAAVRDERGGWLLSMLADVPVDLLGKLSGTGGDRTLAHVAIAAAMRGWPVVTDRADRLRHLAPEVPTISI